jgi:AP-4 complex subunit beta-1
MRFHKSRHIFDTCTLLCTFVAVQLLRNVTVERDPTKRRDVIKKVIAYMTLGVDVSRLFTEMLMAIETRDLVIKKMVYLYMCTYAQSNPDLAIMCVNTLQRDCGNEDPMVRGLALRSLCSLRLPSIVEYIRSATQQFLMLKMFNKGLRQI